MTYGGSNPPLCTITLLRGLQAMAVDMDMSPAGTGRMVVALAILALLALAVWTTMEPGKFQNLAFILLAFFAFRILLGRARSR